jgi:glycosyltransferase involved in cell wall biosynthesis
VIKKHFIKVSKMKIAIVSGIFFPAPGGAQIQSHNFANKLVDLGHDVDSYIFNPTNIKINNYKIFVINKFLSSLVFFCEYYLYLDISFILKIYFKRIIKNRKYDIWHFNFINFKSLIIINILKELNQKIVVTFQGVDVQIDQDINYGYRLNKKYNQFLLKTLKNIDLFLNISDTIKNDLKKINISDNRIVYLPNTVDVKKINNIKNSKEKIISKQLRLITVARYAKKKKGYDLLPIIAQKLLEHNVNYVWTIIGKGTIKLLDNRFIDNNKNLFNIIENIDNYDEKYFPHSSIIDQYNQSDLYVNLARIESFGITFVEAMASGLPVISFNSKGANEVVLDNYNGYLVNSDDLDIFTKKIQDLQNNNFINSIKDNTIKTAEKYDLELVAKKLINIYKKLL